MKGYELLGAGIRFQETNDRLQSISDEILSLKIEYNLRYGNFLFCKQFLSSKQVKSVFVEC